MNRITRRRALLYVRFDGRCFYCLGAIPLERSTADHLVPRSAGGTEALTNLVLACRTCNVAKADTAPRAFLRDAHQTTLEARLAHFGIRSLPPPVSPVRASLRAAQRVPRARVLCGKCGTVRAKAGKELCRECQMEAAWRIKIGDLLAQARQLQREARVAGRNGEEEP